ncbi:hypothetical protein I553_1259 [Mycobacterium xenopi 4042]|uniref:Uncharacterized protein n=1 Tax=Mycobacterium xenopi 4042 TaxID=1299334 RepID=X8CEX6_MYCXE|nr:hypothetical protein I553_1259 [Mycobacterium xenopi 4042]
MRELALDEIAKRLCRSSFRHPPNESWSWRPRVGVRNGGRT